MSKDSCDGIYIFEWNKISREDAQYVLDVICASFNVVAKCYGDKEERDTCYLRICGVYDDDFQSEASKRDCK